MKAQIEIVVEIISAKKLDIVPLLGEFHMLMLFCGSISTIMAGSGIVKLFQNIYGENTVKHKLSSKAVARGDRPHILTGSVPLIKLQQIALFESAESVNNASLEVIQNLYILEKQTLRAILK